MINSLKDNANMSEDDIKICVAKLIKEKRATINFSEVDNNYIDIADFGFKIILTTNYDEILYRYLNQSDYNLPLLLSEFKFPQALDTERYMFHLHGMVTAPDSIVLSQESYEFLYKKKRYMELFKFIGMGKSLIFLGNSVTDTYINDILKALNSLHKIKHYAIFHDSTNREHINKLKKEFNIESILYSANSPEEHVFEIRKHLYNIRTGKALTNVSARTKNKNIVDMTSDSKNATFIGREQEIKLFDDLLYERVKGKNAICFYGEKGVGKTTLLKELEQRIETSEFECFYGSMMKVKEWSLSEFLIVNVDKSQKVIIDETTSLEQFVKEHNNIVVLIDEFQEESICVKDAFILLLNIIRQTRRKIFFVISCISKLDIELIEQREVLPFTETETRDFLVKNSTNYFSLNNLKIMKEKIKDFYSLSMGKPQLFNLILGSESVQQLLGRKFENIDKAVYVIMSQIESTLNHETKMALYLLSMVSNYEVEWYDDIPKSILGVTWGKTVRETLLNKCLLIHLEERYKLHDYVSGYFGNKMEDLQKKEFCQKLAEYYLASDNSQKYFLGLAYCIDYLEISSSDKLLDKYFEFAFSQMRKGGQLKSLRTLLLRLYNSSQRNNCVRKTLNLKIKYAYAIIRQELGETSQVLDIFEELLEQYDSKSKEYCELLLMLADGYRLTGKVKECFEKIQMAIELCKDRITSRESNEEDLLKIRIERAHSLYLLGKFVESKKEYDSIFRDYPSIQEYQDLYSEYCYRYSKTLRSLGFFDKAEEQAKNALLFACSEKYRGLAYWSLCIIETYLFSIKHKESADAIVYYKKAKSIFEKLGYRATIFIDYDIAEIYKLDEEYDRAIELYKSIITITHVMNETNREAFAWLGLAESIRWKKQCDNVDAVAKDSIPHYRKAKELFTYMELEYGELLCSLGEVLASQQYVIDPSPLNNLLNKFSSKYPREKDIVENVISNQKPIGFLLNII